jgi:hypothetical protein
MDIQNDVLDRLGSSYDEEMFHNDFDGKSLEEIQAILQEWFPGEDNDTLAEDIKRYAN